MKSSVGFPLGEGEKYSKSRWSTDHLLACDLAILYTHRTSLYWLYDFLQLKSIVKNVCTNPLSFFGGKTHTPNEKCTPPKRGVHFCFTIWYRHDVTERVFGVGQQPALRVPRLANYHAPRIGRRLSHPYQWSGPNWCRSWSVHLFASLRICVPQ